MVYADHLTYPEIAGLNLGFLPKWAASGVVAVLD